MNLPFFNSPYAIYYSFSSLISSPMGFIGILQLYKHPCVQHNTTQKQRLIKKRGKLTIAHSHAGFSHCPQQETRQAATHAVCIQHRFHACTTHMWAPTLSPSSLLINFARIFVQKITSVNAFNMSLSLFCNRKTVAKI